MTISSFCQSQLLTDGPLSSDELTARAVAAGVTRARNPEMSVLSAIRHRELQLLDGRWVTPLALLEGRCLTTAAFRRPYGAWDEPDADLALLGPGLLDLGTPRRPVPVPGQDEVLCVRVVEGTVDVTTIPAPDPGTLEVASLAQRLPAVAPAYRYGEERRTALRSVTQLMVDDPSSFRTPLPPLSTWVPALVEQARRQADATRVEREWQDEQERRSRGQVHLDDCQAIEVQLAAERAGVPVHVWVTDALDRQLSAERNRYDAHHDVVISLGDRRGEPGR